MEEERLKKYINKKVEITFNDEPYDKNRTRLAEKERDLPGFL